MTSRNERDGTSRKSVLRTLGIAGSSIPMSIGTAARKPATPSWQIERHRDLTYAERPEVDHDDHSEESFDSTCTFPSNGTLTRSP